MDLSGEKIRCPQDRPRTLLMKVPLKEPEARAGGPGRRPWVLAPWVGAIRGEGGVGRKACKRRDTERPAEGGAGGGARVAVTRRRGGRARHGASRGPRPLSAFSAVFRLRSSVSAQNFVFGGILSASGGELRQILYRTIRTAVFFLEVDSSP